MRCFALALLLPFALYARPLVVLTLPPSGFADTESSTNVVIDVSDGYLGRFDVRLAANALDDVRTALGQVKQSLDLRRNWEGIIIDWGVTFSTNAPYQSLSHIVSNNYHYILSNLSLCATNSLERLLVLGVRDQFDANFYMDFMDELVTMKTNGLVSAKEFSWARSTEDPELEKYVERKYRVPRVRELVERFKIAEPINAHWDDVLTGVAYTNYLDEVNAGLWGDNPPMD